MLGNNVVVFEWPQRRGQGKSFSVVISILVQCMGAVFRCSAGKLFSVAGERQFWKNR